MSADVWSNLPKDKVKCEAELSLQKPEVRLPFFAPAIFFDVDFFSFPALLSAESFRPTIETDAALLSDTFTGSSLHRLDRKTDISMTFEDTKSSAKRDGEFENDRNTLNKVKNFSDRVRCHMCKQWRFVVQSRALEQELLAISRASAM